jgi:hypothetical protein
MLNISLTLFGASAMRKAPSVKATLAVSMVGFLPTLSDRLPVRRENTKAEPTVAETISSCQKLVREKSLIK